MTVSITLQPLGLTSLLHPPGTSTRTRTLLVTHALCILKCLLVLGPCSWSEDKSLSWVTGGQACRLHGGQGGPDSADVSLP